ncbi:MAG TPA: hypothetical protein VFS43_46110 [Polyangiaceae bacterium]|nr:hypothetical protein [Polyangiaceae bacterium]
MDKRAPTLGAPSRPPPRARAAPAAGPRARWALAALALAALPLALLSGFTVDDAWIAPRYAAHLASGLGYRFNAGGPPTDGVTPLPWAPLLAPFGGEPLRVWRAARALGALAWLAAAAHLGACAARAAGRKARALPLAALGASAPLGAWACAGTETGVVTALVAFACAAPARARALAAAACGAAASFRPELLPFACVVGAFRSLEPPAPPAHPFSSDSSDSSGSSGPPAPDAEPLAPRPARPRALSVWPFALAVGPWLAVVALRLALFGRPVPLAVDAKPSDFRHGFAYVVAGLLLGGFPALAAAPLALLRRPELSRARWLVAAALAHAASVAAAGGDWMPLSRLLVPAFPALLVAAVDVAALAPLGWTLARLAVALAAMAFAWSRAGAAAASVVGARLPLVERARRSLDPGEVVAALDVGWLAAAGESRIVDLAGRTDPAIAALPGGHTSKRVPATLLDARGVTTLVVLSAEGAPCRAERAPAARAVEERLLRDPWVAGAFEPSDAWASGRLCYVVWRKRSVGGEGAPGPAPR